LTADVAQILDRAVTAGGRVLYPVTEVEPGIRVAEFADCEGNRIAVSSGPA
jgi:predicted enzyme related to lactoylglutathione lyase